MFSHQFSKAVLHWKKKCDWLGSAFFLVLLIKQMMYWQGFEWYILCWVLNISRMAPHCWGLWFFCCFVFVWVSFRFGLVLIVFCFGATWRYSSFIWKILRSEIVRIISNNWKDQSDWWVNWLNSTEIKGVMPDYSTRQSVIKSISIKWVDLLFPAEEYQNCAKN